MRIRRIYGLLWLALAAIGNLNGIARQYLYADLLGEQTAHQLSTLTFIIFSGLLIWFATGRWRLTKIQAKTVGIVWFLMTIAFEFLFGHFVMGHSWARLFSDYNITEGRLWGLVLLWILIAPAIFSALHRKRGEDGQETA